MWNLDPDVQTGRGTVCIWTRIRPHKDPMRRNLGASGAVPCGGAGLGGPAWILAHWQGRWARSVKDSEIRVDRLEKEGGCTHASPNASSVGPRPTGVSVDAPLRHFGTVFPISPLDFQRAPIPNTCAPQRARGAGRPRALPAGGDEIAGRQQRALHAPLLRSMPPATFHHQAPLPCRPRRPNLAYLLRSTLPPRSAPRSAPQATVCTACPPLPLSSPPPRSTPALHARPRHSLRPPRASGTAAAANALAARSASPRRRRGPPLEAARAK